MYQHNIYSPTLSAINTSHFDGICDPPASSSVAAFRATKSNHLPHVEVINASLELEHCGKTLTLSLDSVVITRKENSLIDHKLILPKQILEAYKALLSSIANSSSLVINDYSYPSQLAKQKKANFNDFITNVQPNSTELATCPKSPSLSTAGGYSNSNPTTSIHTGMDTDESYSEVLIQGTSTSINPTHTGPSFSSSSFREKYENKSTQSNEQPMVVIPQLQTPSPPPYGPILHHQPSFPFFLSPNPPPSPTSPLNRTTIPFFPSHLIPPPSPLNQTSSFKTYLSDLNNHPNLMNMFTSLEFLKINKKIKDIQFHSSNNAIYIFSLMNIVSELSTIIRSSLTLTTKSTQYIVLLIPTTFQEMQESLMESKTPFINLDPFLEDPNLQTVRMKSHLPK